MLLKLWLCLNKVFVDAPFVVKAMSDNAGSSSSTLTAVASTTNNTTVPVQESSKERTWWQSEEHIRPDGTKQTTYKGLEESIGFLIDMNEQKVLIIIKRWALPTFDYYCLNDHNIL